MRRLNFEGNNTSPSFGPRIESLSQSMLGKVAQWKKGWKNGYLVSDTRQVIVVYNQMIELRKKIK